MDNKSKDPERGALAPSKQDEGEMPPDYQAGYGNLDTAPPAYNATDPTEPPPSYDSLYGRVKGAKSESKGILDFLKKFLIIILSTIGCTICVALVLAIPISMIVMGSHYLHSCAAERYIPIYLIVGGVFGVLKNLINIGQRLRNKKNDQDEDNARTNPVDSILNCFLCAWFIAGNVWIYRTFRHFTTEDPAAADYCNPTLYWYAFWITTVTYILLGTICLCICCAGILAAVIGDK